MVTPWPFHTYGLDLVGPVNPPLRGYIWILLATEYFTKWAEAMPLQKATGGAVANFIEENIIVRFGVPQRIISDNGTPFVNNDVRKMLEFYQVKHHRSSPYYPQGNGQVEGTDKVLIKIEPRVHRRMGNTPAKCPLGLQKITEVYHRIFILFLGIRDRSSKPSRSDDSIFESYADTREGKRGKSLDGRKV